MTSRLRGILHTCLGLLFAVGAASAQTSVTPPGALAPEAIQPWGLPPPPPGVGPVELFADIHDTPQGKFLEGGAFDTDGNFWFVAIDTGWVSYTTSTKQLVPVFNCDPPPEIGV
jgi:gluconolactonase